MSRSNLKPLSRRASNPTLYLLLISQEIFLLAILPSTVPDGRPDHPDPPMPQSSIYKNRAAPIRSLPTLPYDALTFIKSSQVKFFMKFSSESTHPTEKEGKNPNCFPGANCSEPLYPKLTSAKYFRL